MHFGILLFISLFISVASLFSQASKPVIDSIAIEHWKTFSNELEITDDGNWFMYIVNNEPKGGQTVVFQNTSNSIKRQFPKVETGFLCADNKQAVFKRNDTIFILNLKSGEVDCIQGVSKYSRPRAKSVYLVYTTKYKPSEIILFNITTRKRRICKGVINYAFDEKGENVAIVRNGTNHIDSVQQLECWDILANKAVTVWRSNGTTSIESYSFDRYGTQLVFMIKTTENGATNYSLWHWSRGMVKSILIADNSLVNLPTASTVKNSPPYFSYNGKYIFFQISTPQVETKRSPGAVMVDIWSYKDSILQSTQLLHLNAEPKSYTCVVDVKSKRVLRLEHEDEWYQPISNVAPDADFVIVGDKNSIADPWWKSYQKRNFYLMSLKDGSRRLINKSDDIRILPETFSFSPGGKYLLFYDYNAGCYYSYNLSLGTSINISRNLSTSIDDIDIIGTLPVGVAGWIPQDEALFVYDNYDIWKIDPEARVLPINLTNGYGRRRHIKLRIITNSGSSLDSPESNNIYNSNELVLLTGFNTLSKANSFFRKTLLSASDPASLSEVEGLIYTCNSQTPFALNSLHPLKAKHQNKWIVMFQSASVAPNFFLTKDFAKFTSMTSLQPQKNYNWLKAELVEWKQLDGTYTQGILYAPEDFNANEKYPLILNFYEKLSHRLYSFLEPEFSGGAINIPWFVSRGYLVLTPDIHYKIGETGESVKNAVVSAAKYASTLPYVDTSKIAITGHSFGGYETNYLVTHSSIFAAAASAAGNTDLISAYASLGYPSFGAGTLHYKFESGQYRMGKTLWQDPNGYINSSPLINADKVTTPLLITHNKADALVPWSQAVEFYVGLRRLQKPTWMLQYDTGGHGVRGIEGKDFTKRITQYFDHYLKEAPPPKWMTKGVPAKLKGIDSGLELDPDGFCSDNCKVCREKNYAHWTPVPF